MWYHHNDDWHNNGSEVDTDDDGEQVQWAAQWYWLQEDALVWYLDYQPDGRCWRSGVIAGTIHAEPGAESDVAIVDVVFNREPPEGEGADQRGSTNSATVKVAKSHTRWYSEYTGQFGEERDDAGRLWPRRLGTEPPELPPPGTEEVYSVDLLPLRPEEQRNARSARAQLKMMLESAGDSDSVPAPVMLWVRGMRL